MSLFSEAEILNEQIENHTSTYECPSCHKKFSGKEMLVEEMVNNFSIVGLEVKQKLPKCPHCKAVAFFGFREV